MGLAPRDIVLLAVGFLMIAILTPIGIGTIVNTSVSGWNAAVVTCFTVLLPILYIIGVAMYFIPRSGE